VPQQQPFGISAGSVISVDHIVSAQVQYGNSYSGSDELSLAYEHARPNQTITYGIESGAGPIIYIQRPAVTFTWEMWWQSYGLTFIAGLSWLVVGFIVLLTARGWVGAVEGITLLPPAMLFLLYSHWGNVQSAYPADGIFQLLWIPSFALLGAAFIHLSLTYRPEALNSQRRPSLAQDALPYVPLVGLLAFEWSSYLFKGNVPTQINLTFALCYGAFGGVLSVIIGLTSLVRVSRRRADPTISSMVRRRLGDLLTLWIGGVGLGFCLGILPILLTGKTLLPLEIFYVLAAIYPLLLLYAMRSLRMIDRLQASLQEREQALHTQQQMAVELHKTLEELRQSNRELEQATSLLLHADAHLRSILSQRIHDQPRQQALRIRSLLGHWQHKLKIEAERDPEGKVPVPPIIDALGKVRKISEELESDLRGLQLLVEDAYQRRSLGLKLHLEKLIREDLPALHPESPLKVQADLWALDALSHNLEKTPEGAKIAEAISYTVTQALLNVYNHAGANFATVRATRSNGFLDIFINDDGRGFDPNTISPDRTSLFKARLKAREAGGVLAITSRPRPGQQHGTLVQLRIPIPPVQEYSPRTGPLSESRVQSPGV
jgi:anti-sigma regulatory factor (Ser/Thr protein kinase)